MDGCCKDLVVHYVPAPFLNQEQVVLDTRKALIMYAAIIYKGSTAQTNQYTITARIILQSTQKVGFANAFPSGFPRTLRNLVRLLETLSCFSNDVSRSILLRIVFSRDDIRGLFVQRDLARLGRCQCGHFLLVTLSLFFIQCCFFDAS